MSSSDPASPSPPPGGPHPGPDPALDAVPGPTSPRLQEEYDDAMHAFSREEYDSAIAQLKRILEVDSAHFDAQLALGMALYRKGDFPAAIREGHVAEKLQPKEQLVHTNLSLFYMKSGDKVKAEHHGLQARIAGWRENMNAPATPAPEGDPELQLARPPRPRSRPP